MNEPQGPYAKCQDCDLTFADRDAAGEHSQATMAPVKGQGGLIASGHRYLVVNPTPEEVRERRVRSAIMSALDDFYDEIDQQVQRGDFTEDEVREEMRWFDLGDGWDDYVKESGS